MYQRYHLSHADAWRIIEVIRARLEADGKEAAIAVADAQGELIAFLRTDGCNLPPITIAINKAFTTARARKPTAAVGQASRTEGFPMTNYGDPRYTAWGGGVPVVYRGQVVGGIGVSNLTEEEDAEYASLGAALFVE